MVRALLLDACFCQTEKYVIPDSHFMLNLSRHLHVCTRCNLRVYTCTVQGVYVL